MARKKIRKRRTLANHVAEAIKKGGCLIRYEGLARRVYKHHFGKLTTIQYVCHRCDNPKCIRIEHLFLGSCKDNVQDAVKKGRHSCFENIKIATLAHTGVPRSAEDREKIGESSKKRWSDPIFKQRVSEKIKLAYSKKDVLEKTRVHSLAMWKDLEFLAKRKLLLDDPDYRSKNRRSLEKARSSRGKRK